MSLNFANSVTVSETPILSKPHTFSFDDTDIDLFARASWDRNPLHCSAQYAHTTPFGEQVVFGIMGALNCLARIDPPSQSHPTKVDLQFKNPMVLDTTYSVRAGKNERGQTASVMDGSRTHVSASVEFGPNAPALYDFPASSYEPSSVARRLIADDIKQTSIVEAPYQPILEPYEALLAKLGISREAWGDPLISFLMLSSYVIGMQIPGESAMFFSCRIEMEPPRPLAGPFRYRLELVKFDARMDRAVLSLTMSDEAGLLGKAELQAFLRPSRKVTLTTPVLSPDETHLLDGKLAVIVGASRGLGANLALSLAARGATVIGTYARSDDDAQAVTLAAEVLTGKVIMEKSDCSSGDACQAIRDKYLAPHGGLDILICCACPSLSQLRFEPESADRILSFLQHGLDLVCTPLCSWLPMLNSVSGVLLYISSSAVEEPPAAWPHYVAMKSAGEGLVRSALTQYPAVTAIIARPSKILTDLINTPLGRFQAEDPGVVSERLITSVATPNPERLAYLS